MVAMDKRLLATNLGIAVTVQGFAFVVSAVTAFVVPKVLGVDNFGYWQLFLFYVGYLGFAQLGISDGAYLRYGGQRRDEIDRSAVVQQFFVITLLQIVLGIALLALIPLVLAGERMFIFSCVIVMIPLLTAVRYWGFIFQAMNETKLFSYSVLIQNVAFFGLMVILIVLGVSSERPYIVAYVISLFPTLAFCLYNSRDFLGVRGVGLSSGISESLASIRVGFKLLLAALSGNLILGAARLVVDAKWDISTFGAVSLAITLVTFFLTLMAQAALVLFPALRQADHRRRMLTMVRVRGLALLVLPSAYVLYFPIVFILAHWLPSYATSFDLAALVMPICIFDGMMQILYSTYFKVVRKEGTLMILNLFAFALCIGGVLVSGYMLRNLELVLLSPAVASLARGLIADHLFLVGAGAGGRIDGAFNVGFTLMFVGAARYLPLWDGFLFVMIGYLALVGSRRSDARWLVGSLRSAVNT